MSQKCVKESPIFLNLYLEMETNNTFLTQHFYNRLTKTVFGEQFVNIFENAFEHCLDSFQLKIMKFAQNH